MGDIIPKVGSPKDYEYLIMADGGEFDETYTELAKVFTDGKVPNLTDGRFLEGNTDVGQVKGAGVPNITGSITFRTVDLAANDLILSDDKKPTGAFDKELVNWAGAHNKVVTTNASPYAMEKMTMDSSRSNPIYGSSDTVQPKSYTVKYYICYGG